MFSRVNWQTSPPVFCNVSEVEVLNVHCVGFTGLEHSSTLYELETNFYTISFFRR